MVEISMVVTSLDRWGPYRLSDGRVLELVKVTASLADASEGVAAGMAWLRIVEPHDLAKDQAQGGYMMDSRQVQMTFGKSARVRLGDRIKFRIA